MLKSGVTACAVSNPLAKTWMCIIALLFLDSTWEITLKQPFGEYVCHFLQPSNKQISDIQG